MKLFNFIFNDDGAMAKTNIPWNFGFASADDARTHTLMSRAHVYARRNCCILHTTFHFQFGGAENCDSHGHTDPNFAIPDLETEFKNERVFD